jgi:SAM-dependent methyltransferase
MAERTEADWKEDSRSFDTVARLYDACRPGYPEALITSLIDLAGLTPASRLLEIGCGTGKATLRFAEKGYSILCVEPGANLAAVAAENLKARPKVTFEITRFEDWTVIPEQFDLVFSAQAFHWVPQPVGYRKIAQTLKLDGSMALFWNMYPGPDGPVWTEIAKVYQSITPGLATPQAAIEDEIRRRVKEINDTGLFGPVTILRFPWSATYTTRQYLGLLNTYSDHLRQPEGTRQKLFSGIAALIDKNGGTLDRPYVTAGFLARKAKKGGKPYVWTFCPDR